MSILKTFTDTAFLSAGWLRLEGPRLPRASPRGSGRHLALFAWALPPHSSAGVYRPLSFLRYGCSRGWRVDAFCGEAQQEQRRNGDELLAQVPAKARLHVVPASSREPSYRFFPRIDGGFANALEYARHASRKLAGDPPDIVVASGPPFFTFVSALWTARHFRVPLVLDYRDEWTECPFDFVANDRDDRAWERRCLSNADAVLFTTASHRKHQLATFPELASHKTHVVPNGWEPDDFVTQRSESLMTVSREDDPLRLAHVGTLAGHARPQDLLDSLKRLLTDEPEWTTRIRIQFIGRRSPSADSAIRSFAFPDVVQSMDHVGKREANRRMQESDVLVLIASPDLERYLPGKLFDYIAARRPILVFGSRGESSELIERLGAGSYCPSGSGTALRDALVRLHDLDTTQHSDAIDSWLYEHRRDVLALRVFSIFDSLTPLTRTCEFSPLSTTADSSIVC